MAEREAENFRRTPRLGGLYRELARANFAAYCQYVHEGRWVPARHLLYVCRKVQDFLLSDPSGAYGILLLQMPPQHGKSMTVTETAPSFFHGHFPDKNIILASYNDETAQRFTRRNREKLERFGPELFGVTTGKLSRADEYELEGGRGRLISRGIMGGITSNPADLILIDDPIKNRQEADSAVYRTRLWEEWLSSVKTRLAAHAKIIVIMTRWHEDDLAGRILQSEKGVKVVSLPCEAEENDPLGRKPGEALFPEIGKGNRWLRQFKAGYTSQEGARAWSALFQGRPSPQKGALLNRSWWRYYDGLPRTVRQLISVDAAFKAGDSSDFVCIQCWGKRGADMFLLDCDTRRLDFPETLEAIRSMKRKWPEAGTVLVEDKANGSAIIAMLQHEIPGVVPVNPQGGKAARVSAVSPAIEAGNVYLPRRAPWLGDFLEECAAFPGGVHDDRVDAMSQALNRFIYCYAKEPEAPKKNALPWALRDEETKGSGWTEW